MHFMDLSVGPSMGTFDPFTKMTSKQVTVSKDMEME